MVIVHVLIQITLGIVVGHVDAVELVHHVGQHPSCWHHEEGIPHMVGRGAVCLSVRLSLFAYGFDKGKYLIKDSLEHNFWRCLLEVRPMQFVLVGR